jgi:hypothetical protein
VDHVRADLRLGLLDPLLDLLQEAVDRFRPWRPLEARSKGLSPLSRAWTYRLTVFGSCPVSSAADQTVFVRSYASKISMISLSDLVTGPLRPVAHAWKHQQTGRRGLRQIRERSGTPQLKRPSTGISGGHQPGLNWPHTWTLTRPPSLLKGPG